MASKSVQMQAIHLAPTALVPNSQRPLLYYPSLFMPGPSAAEEMHRRFATNGWRSQWVFRYGSTQESHYHSDAHECMAVLSGTATIRFGVGDLVDGSSEEGGIEIEAKAGDVFVLPAGVAHKTTNALPARDFKLLTPGDGHTISSGESGTSPDSDGIVLAAIKHDGFTMLGAYPNGSDWDFRVAGQDVDRYEKVWRVPLPGKDPVIGTAETGLCGVWK